MAESIRFEQSFLFAFDLEFFEGDVGNGGTASRAVRLQTRDNFEVQTSLEFLRFRRD